MQIYDSVVIGGGPAGETAALYLLRSGVKVLLVEKLAPGGQVLNTEEIENYPGFPDGIKGYELADLLDRHVSQYPLDRKRDEVKGVNKKGNHFEISLEEGAVHGRSVVVASGSRYRKLGIPGETEFAGRGVSYCALCDGHFYKDKTVAVVGGGNTALEEALYLTKLVEKLYLVHRRDEFRGERIYQEKCLIHPKIACRLSKTVMEITGDASGVTGVVVQDVKSGEKETVAVDGAFIFIGFEPNGGFYPEGIETDPQDFILTDCEMRTNIPGIFAAGDIRSKLCRQVVTAAGDGATAAHSAFLYLENLDD